MKKPSEKLAKAIAYEAKKKAYKRKAMRTKLKKKS